MFTRRFASLAVSTAAALFALSAAPAAMADVLAANGQWTSFDVAEDLSNAGLSWIDLGTGNKLSFSFTVAEGFEAHLTVVDGGFAGDQFRVFDGQQVLGETSVPGASNYPNSLGLDYDAALANAAYSRGSFILGAGQHEISGLLIQSVSVGGTALNSTTGGIRLELTPATPVPEPSTLATLLAGMALLTLTLRRRQGK